MRRILCLSLMICLALGLTLLAIYELNGDDLKIGFGNDGPVQVRPKRWEIGKEDVVWLLVLKRNAKDKVPDDKEQETEDKAVEAIKKLGGTITRDEQATGNPVIGVSFEHTGITNEGLAHLNQLENLESLDLDSTQITDAGLAELKSLKNLQTLVIGYNKITGTGLAELKDLKNLQHLDLIHCGITDAGAKCLAELQSLKTIDLRGTQITDAGLKELKSLHNLKELNLCLVPGGPFAVTIEGIKELRAALPEANIVR